MVLRDRLGWLCLYQVSEKVMSDASSGLGFVILVAFLGLSWGKKLGGAWRWCPPFRTRRREPL